ncbi:hypothetical protein LH464_15120 [Neorhizobium sp. T786]|uniref:hypothetical protein n=1 Tax=Pseudorhizobium xiangyangii TaxID=2883104 RepID=UPI001CFFD789|nr:hypothetical protein [Neorhizobium xiangyangii]MCB5203802.1 hypothetical protein [Neorhizobium xiangyangii]
MPETRASTSKPRFTAIEYGLEEFRAAYDLPREKAQDLFDRFGPSKAELDAMMKAIINRGSVKYWL